MRYVIHPGQVKSRTDGQLHHIGVKQLFGLYGLRASDHWISADVPEYREREGDVHLRPRYDGAYYNVHGGNGA